MLRKFASDKFLIEVLVFSGFDQCNNILRYELFYRKGVFRRRQTYYPYTYTQNLLFLPRSIQV